MSSWMKAKADELLQHQVEQVLAETQFPEPALAEGMVEALYAVGLFDDLAYGYWMRRIAVAVSERRKVLSNERIKSLLADGPKLTGVKA